MEFSGIDGELTGGDNVQVPNLPEIKGVVLGDTIGQGAFGCVKNAYVERDPNVIFAVKFMHLPTCERNGCTEKDITKEVVLHSNCSRHPNILKLIDCSMANDFFCIYLEIADGGDLFDKIEPDVGVDTEIAQFYFKQLVNAISYLHNECGVAHRDIKPENILLDRSGNLKLADFGLASKFKRKDGSKRISTDKRGSYPYMAPEILNSEDPSYYADLTDIWSIGILIFVLLTGEIPWEIPTIDDQNFVNFIKNNGKLTLGPWAKIEFSHLNLLRKILQPIPAKRVSLKNLQLHPWFTKKIEFSNSKGLCNNPSLLAKKLFSNLKVSLSDESYDLFTQNIPTDNLNFASTQPLTTDFANIEHDFINSNLALPNTQVTAFSQYIPKTIPHNNDKSITQTEKWNRYIKNDISTLQFYPNSNIEFFKNLKFNPIKLDKFYTIESMETLLPLLEKVFNIRNIIVKSDILERFEELVEEYGIDKVFPVNINIKAKDRRKNNIAGSILISVIDNELKVINFQRKSGDPLEWRRLFKEITLYCRDLIYIPNED